MKNNNEDRKAGYTLARALIGLVYLTGLVCSGAAFVVGVYYMLSLAVQGEWSRVLTLGATTAAGGVLGLVLTGIVTSVLSVPFDIAEQVVLQSKVQLSLLRVLDEKDEI